MRIRSAGLDDATHVARIQVETWRSAYAGIISAGHLAGLSVEKSAAYWEAAIARGEAGKFLLVIEAEGAPRGFLAGGPLRSPVAGYDGEIYACYVEAAFQRKSLGEGLFKAGLDRLHQLGMRAAAVWVLRENPCRRFYEKMGGRPLGEKSLPRRSMSTCTSSRRTRRSTGATSSSATG